MTIDPEPFGIGAVVKSFATTVVANEVYFGDLDAVVGDGDFGYSLARGFEQVLASWDDLDPSEAGPFLQRVGLIITSHVGGTSGPIWGTAAIRAARVASQHAEIDGAVVADMLDAAVDGIRARGGASVGDKTLLDALVPAVDALRAALETSEPGDRVVDAMARAARQGAESTKALQARRGRASYAGERSIGSYDAGAVAVAVLLEDLAAAWPRTS